MKTSELTGPALDWAVAKCEGLTVNQLGSIDFINAFGRPQTKAVSKYSTDWSQGGPIIELDLIELSIDGKSIDGMWVAKSPDYYKTYSGPTPLISAMRCYVASKLGDEVDVPEELV
jgi:hypothetical protein